jgi:hypothetical protein
MWHSCSHLCWEWSKVDCYTRCLQKGRAALMPNLLEIFIIVPPCFLQIMLEQSLCFFRLPTWAAFLPVCNNNTGSATFKHFYPLVHTSSWRTVQSTPGGQLSMEFRYFHSFGHNSAFGLSLALTSSGAVLLMPCSLSKNQQLLTSTSPPNLEL